MKAILSKVKKCFQTHPDAVLAVIAILYGLMFLPAIIIQDDLKWLYTALTRAVSKVYLVNFPDSLF